MITSFAWFGYELPKNDCFALLKESGFDGVTLWWASDFGDDNFRINPALARNAGLFVENIHAPFETINNLWLDTMDGNSLLDYFMQLVADCANYDIPTMVLHLSSGSNPPPHNKLGLNRMKRIVEKAESHGVNIAFENLRRLEYLDYMLSNLDSPCAGFCYDSGHHACWAPNDDLLAKYGSRLMALHLHDNDGTGDQHLLPFDGTIDWLETMRNIAQTGYTGPVALEVENSGYEKLPPNEFLSVALERGKKLKGLK